MIPNDKHQDLKDRARSARGSLRTRLMMQILFPQNCRVILGFSWDQIDVGVAEVWLDRTPDVSTSLRAFTYDTRPECHLPMHLSTLGSQ